jgi:preprotein translocase subunit SecA
MKHVEKDVMLRTLDQHWREHLAAMDYLRQGIHLRGYAQKDYRFEYKREAYELFSNMLDRVKYDTASILTRVTVRSDAELQREEELRQRRLMRALQAQHAEAQSLLAAGEEAAPAPATPTATGSAGARAAAMGAGGALPGLGGEAEGGAAPFVRGDRKVGRNEPCPCGSGKKYKHCHGQLQQA